MPNNAGKGRQKGSRNKITQATLAMAKSGESPLELMLRVSQDEEAALVLRLNAARYIWPLSDLYDSSGNYFPGNRSSAILSADLI